MPTPRFGNCHSSGYRSQTCWPLGEFGGGFGGGSGVSSLEYWTRSADHRYELRFGVLEVSILSLWIALRASVRLEGWSGGGGVLGSVLEKTSRSGGATRKA
jgi:hypothetical protein